MGLQGLKGLGSFGTKRGGFDPEVAEDQGRPNRKGTRVALVTVEPLWISPPCIAEGPSVVLFWKYAPKNHTKSAIGGTYFHDGITDGPPVYDLESLRCRHTLPQHPCQRSVGGLGDTS